MDSNWYFLTNQGSQAVKMARRAIETLPENWLFARGNAMLYLGMSMNMEGQYHQAVELLMENYHRLQGRAERMACGCCSVLLPSM